MTLGSQPQTDVLRPSGQKALLIDGKKVAESVLAEVAAAAAALAAKGVKPGLAVVLVGENPASQVYVRSKGKAALSCGFHSVQHDLPETTSEADLIDLVDGLNADPAIHGILVQLPLPPAIHATRVLERVSPRKDVDGFHPFNAGLLSVGDLGRALVPCTPAGSMLSARTSRRGARRRDFRRRRGRRRAFEHCRQTDGAIAALAQCDGYGRPFAQPRS